MLISLQHITKSFAQDDILSDVSITVEKGDRIGVVGANGSGKTTLLKILAGLLQSDEGDFTMAKNTTIGYVPQAPEYDDKLSVKVILMELVEPREEYRVDAALQVLGIEACKEQRFGELSSGQRTRVYLARIVIERCDVLLLDEPTNHLDLSALHWLEQYLKRFNGALCVVSHDRAFLDAVTNRTFVLEDGSGAEYGGNYSFYREQKEIEREAQRRSYEAQQKEIKRLKQTARQLKADAVRADNSRKQTRDNDKYTATFFANRVSNKKASVAKAIEHKVDQIDVLDRPKTDPTISVLLKREDRGSTNVASVRDVSYEKKGETILSNVSFEIERGDRILLSGKNGSGKTTLIKLLLGEIQPSAGEISLGESISIGYLSQEHEVLQSSHTVIDELVEKTGIETSLAHQLLARLLVSREKMRQPVDTLSKGEQSKVLLAEIIASGANFIILDEPTNHLDVVAREALEAALCEYDGTLLVVSHDRYFVDAIEVSKQLQLESGSLRKS